MKTQTEQDLKVLKEIVKKIANFVDQQGIIYDDNLVMTKAKAPMMFLQQVDDLLEDNCDELADIITE